MSDSVRPHRQQPTRLLCPWDSPGKNTGVGWHFLLQHACTHAKVLPPCLTLWLPPGSSWPRESLGKNTRVGCYFLLCKRGRLYSNIILWMQSHKAVRKLTHWFHIKYHSPYVYVKIGYPLQYILHTMFYTYNFTYLLKKKYV